MGCARLAILDPRPEGNQPFWNDDHSIAIVLNGEIYNYRRLRDEEKFQCRTNTDTEVLLKLYERHGTKFFPRLRGMFALAIYDVKKRLLLLARDSGGILPLFVAYPESKLHFASETRALLACFQAKPALNFEALSMYMRLQYVPGPETLCEGIEALPPGTILISREGKEERMSFQPDAIHPPFQSKEEFKGTFPRIMDEVVADHMIADRPIGLFLSGGMDSSIVLHHMSAHAKPVRTFTVRFEATEEEGRKRFNTDADLARETVRHYGTEHRELFLTADLFREGYRGAARALDQPNADSVSVAQFLLAKLAKESGVDVVLSGAGGDELFGGYPRYRIARILHMLRFIPPALRKTLGEIFGYPSDVLALSPGPALAERLLARPATEIERYVKGGWFEAGGTTKLFENEYDIVCHGEHVMLSPSKHEPWHSSVTLRQAQGEMLRHFMEFDRRLWLVAESLRLADATTLGNGLESRVPFLDPRIIAASHATPSEWHVTCRRTKALLKDTYRNILPSHLFTLDKSSFFPPLAKWFRRESASLFTESLEHPRIRELFDVAELRTIYEEHLSRKKYHFHTLSSITQLRFWFEEVYDA